MDGPPTTMEKSHGISLISSTTFFLLLVKLRNKVALLLWKQKRRAYCSQALPSECQHGEEYEHQLCLSYIHCTMGKFVLGGQFKEYELFSE